MLLLKSKHEEALERARRDLSALQRRLDENTEEARRQLSAELLGDLEERVGALTSAARAHALQTAELQEARDAAAQLAQLNKERCEKLLREAHEADQRLLNSRTEASALALQVPSRAQSSSLALAHLLL